MEEKGLRPWWPMPKFSDTKVAQDLYCYLINVVMNFEVKTVQIFNFIQNF